MSEEQRLVMATSRLTSATGQDRGDKLRRAAEALAYRAAMDHVQALTKIENSLAGAAVVGWSASDVVNAEVLDIVRTYMCRGLIRAQAERGDRAAFWVPR